MIIYFDVPQTWGCWMNGWIDGLVTRANKETKIRRRRRNDNGSLTLPAIDLSLLGHPDRKLVTVVPILNHRNICKKLQFNFQSKARVNLESISCIFTESRSYITF